MFYAILKMKMEDVTFLIGIPNGEGPMKKWHMEGIVRPAASYSRRLEVPDEDQMYGRIRGYVSARPRESMLIVVLRKVAGWFLSFI